MTSAEASASPSIRAKVSTGYARLDEALQGGFLAGSMVVLSAPASDEVPLLLKNFLESARDESFLICRTLSSAENLAKTEHVKALVCSDKPVPPAKNILPGKGTDNLTELNLAITDAINSLQPKRLAIDLLSDILLRHKALQTRKWLTELLERLRSKGVTTLTTLNPYMHAQEENEAVTGLFDGSLEILEKQTEEGLRKFVRVKWMHGVDVAEKEFLLEGLTAERETRTEQVVATPAHLKEPRWLTPLISRTAELNKLKTAFEEALQGKSSVVALQGEAGIGKSRLMQELAAYASSKGAIALSGSASQDGPPYGPWIEVARQYVAQAPGELLRRMLGANASELVKLVSDLAVKLGTIPPPRTGGGQDKTQFYEAVTQFFIAISQQSPLLVLFEDTQHLDQSSAELWEYLVRRTSDLHILTVCSTPPEREIESNSQLEQSLTKFNKERLLETITLRGLSEDETTTLIKQTFGEQTVSPEFADLVYQHTGGNPFFVEEVLRSLVADGTIFRTEKGWDRKPIQDITIPKTVKTALKARLGKLDPQAVSTLEWAAMIGPVFDFEVLRDASGASEDALLDALTTANNQGLILELPNQQGKLTFQDERIRELLLEDIMLLKRRRYHQKIAEAMEKLYAQKLESNSDAIATHFELAGDKERTTKYSMMAGDWARSIHAYPQAITSYKRVLRKVDANDAKQRASLLEKLADSYYMAGTFPDSLEAYQEALKLLEKLQEHAACARISTQIASQLYKVKGPSEAVHFLEEAVKYVEGTPESSEAASLYGKTATFLTVLDRYEEGNEWSKRALEAGEKSGNHAAISEALRNMAYFFLDTGRIDEGLPLMERSLDVARQHNLYYQTTACLLCLGNYVYPRSLSRAREYASQLLEVGKEANDLYIQAATMVWLALFDWLRGDWAGALKGFREAFDVKNQLGFRFMGLNAEAWRAELCRGFGELEEAEEFCRLALERHDEQISHIVATNLVVGKLRLEQGRVEEAKVHFEACVAVFKDHEFTTHPLWHIEALVHLTGIYTSLGQPEKAREMVDWAKRLAETLKSNAGLAMAAQAEASFLQASGESQAAQEAYQKSLSLWEKAGWPYYKAKASVAYSEADSRSQPEESGKSLLAAAEIFRKFGAKRDLEKAEEALKNVAM